MLTESPREGVVQPGIAVPSSVDTPPVGKAGHPASQSDLGHRRAVAQNTNSDVAPQ
jgi:hypothetical protein